MSRALWVELTRLRWRRAALVLVGAAIFVPLAMALQVALSSPAPSDAQVARAHKQSERQIARCVKHHEEYGIPDSGDAERQCRDMMGSEYLFDGPALNLDSERQYGVGPASVAVVGVLMFLLGTTFVGHDWNTGSMSNQLLFQPRRLRLWFAKALAVTVTALVVGAVALTAVWLILGARYRSGGSTIPDGLLRAGLEQGWRGAAIAGVAAWCGYALTMLSRSTVFTLGLLFGVSVAAGVLINTLVDDPGPIDPTINVSAVIKHGTTYYVDVPCSDMTGDSGGSCGEERVRSLGQGVGYIAVVSIVLGAGSVLSFRRRDVA